MAVVVPRDLSAVLTALHDEPEAHLLAGGTDLMVEVNFGHRKPPAVICLRNVRELRERTRTDTHLRLGSGVTYTDLAAPDVAADLPALTAAARTVGSPQIRNAGTLGGNIGTGSPAGDTLPVLAALDAVIELVDVSGAERSLPWRDFFLAPKRTARRADEVISGVSIPLSETRQDYLKVGTRNAMVISVAGLALVVDITNRQVRCALGSVGPVPIRADAAEAWVREEVDWDAVRIDDPRTYETFATMVADAARPIDDHRSTADYRRHAVKVMAQRSIMRLL
jgi:CO/xanthine dehydrogenase FAD-binding subunit